MQMGNFNVLKLLTLTVIFLFSLNTAKCSTVKAIYWLEQPFFPPSAINTQLFTHVFYAFVEPNNSTFLLEISNSTATSLTTFTTTLRSVTTLLSIGGANSNSALFARIAADVTARAIFIDSTISVARNFGFHGVDLDWEFPKTSDEMNNLGQLFSEWRTAIIAESAATCRPPLLLTAAVYFAMNFPFSGNPATYPVASINENVDWVNVMSYDLHGSWSNKTGAPAGMFDPKGNSSVVNGLWSWIRGGALPQKLVMGVPLFGRTWKLQDPNVHGIGAPAVGAGPGSDGAMAFFQILDFNNKTGARVVYDVDTASVYSYDGSYWIGYDDPFTVAMKVGFAQGLYLRGYFFWAAGLDTTDWKISTQASKAWMYFAARMNETTS